MLAHVTPGEVATLAALFIAGLILGAALAVRWVGRRDKADCKP